MTRQMHNTHTQIRTYVPCITMFLVTVRITGTRQESRKQAETPIPVQSCNNDEIFSFTDGIRIRFESPRIQICT